MREVKPPDKPRTLGDRIDGFIAAFSPERALRRKAARMYLDRAERAERKLHAWDAAKSDRTGGGAWLASRLSFDGDLKEDLQTLRDRSREAVKNDPYATSFVDAFVTNTVGREIRVQSRIRAGEGDNPLTEEQAKTFNDELEALWRRQSEYLGVNGESIHELQQLSMRHWAKDGEILVVFSASDDKERPVPLQVQVVNPDRLETPPGYEKKNVVLGIERDASGKIVAYHIRRGVVGDPTRDKYEFDRVEAERVCHVFVRWDTDQTRGFPMLGAALRRLKDLRDHDESVLINEQVAACFGVIVKTTNPLQVAEASASRTVTDANGNAVQELRPAGIHYVDQASDITVTNPSSSGSGNSAAFSQGVLQAIAAGCNTPVEIIGKDYTKTTYSSGRLSLIDGRLNYQLAQQNFIRGVLRHIWCEFVRQAVAFGLTSIDASDFAKRPWVYDRGQWMPPGWPWIDPQKDVQASVEALDGDLTTLSDELASRGIDFEEWLERRKIELAKLAELAELKSKLIPVDPNQPTEPGKPKKPAAKPQKKLERLLGELCDRLERLEAAR